MKRIETNIRIFAVFALFQLCIMVFCTPTNPTQQSKDDTQYRNSSDKYDDVSHSNSIDSINLNFIDIVNVGLFSDKSNLICTLSLAGFPDTLWLKNFTMYGDTIHSVPDYKFIFDFWSSPLTYEDMTIDLYFFWNLQGKPNFITTLESNFAAEISFRAPLSENSYRTVSIPIRFIQIGSKLIFNYQDFSMLTLEKNIKNANVIVQTSFRGHYDELVFPNEN